MYNGRQRKAGYEMDYRDWEGFGEEIRQTIQDAVEYGNYDRLNQTITNTVNRATNWMNHNAGTRGGAGSYGQTSYGQTSYGQTGYGPTDYGNPKRDDYSQRPDLYQQSSTPKAVGVLLTVFGYLFAVPIAIWTICILAIIILLMDFSVEAITTLAVSLVVLCPFLWGAVSGTKKLTGLDRFEKYRKEIGSAQFCRISALASRVGRPTSFVVKDLENMIGKGWFLQGHLDRNKTCLIVTDDMYRQYLLLEQRSDLGRAEAENARAEAVKAGQDAQDRNRGAEEEFQKLSPEVQKIMKQGKEYLRKIHECNDAIPGEEISEKITRIETIVDKIFDCVRQNQSAVSNVRKLMEYYLPTTVKLLEAYAQMDAQPIQGDNIQKAKREIETTLDTLNVAFEKLLDDMFQDKAWDISSDISVLNTMLAQEGLKDDGFNKKS